MQRILIDAIQVKEGMITAKDVFTDSGLFLIPADTRITEDHLKKLHNHNIAILSVFVANGYKGPVIEDPYETFDKIIESEIKLSETTSEKAGSIKDSRAFKVFERQYTKQVQVIKDELSKIVTTGIIDAAPLYSLIDDIVLTTAADKQLFSYMCRMRSHNDVTYTHAMNVSMLAAKLGQWLGFPLHVTTELALAGILHDIGKIKIPVEILEKPGKLTDDEFNLIKQHSVYGYELIANSGLPLGVKHAVLMHHEKLDGRGYPLGLSLDRIHQYAKIIAVVDIYDAMTAERPYHERYHPFHVIRMFEMESYGQLDKTVLDVFLERIAHNYMNDVVKLSNGTEGKIIFIHHRNPSKPIIQLNNGKVVDLQLVKDLDITDFL